MGGVYKLAAIKNGDTYIPKIKISESAEKITTPHLKSVYRFYNKETGKAVADYITMHDETVDVSNGITIFDPVDTWKKIRLKNITAKPMLNKLYDKGVRVYNSPSLKEIKEYCKEQVELLWDEVRRFENPHKYYVDLSKKLW